MAPRNPLRELEQAGTNIWLDSIHRHLLRSGQLEHMVAEDRIRGLTSNPTMFQTAIGEGTDYDDQIRTLARQNMKPADISRELAVDDIRAAADVLHPIYRELALGDGFACMEVSPEVAHDTEAMIKEARELWSMLDRPNVMITVPGTPEGIQAMEWLINRGLNVNVTLLFDVETYANVAAAYMSALERRHAGAQPIRHVASVATFFLSRVDVAVDQMLEAAIAVAQDEREKERLHALKGKAAIANAKLAYERYHQLLSEPRWYALAALGAMPQRLLWASISTKDPAYRDVMYVEALTGGNTVMTLPQNTLNAFKDHGVVRPNKLSEDLEGAHQTSAELKSLGIDLDTIAPSLLADGLQIFADSRRELLDSIENKRRVMLAGV